MYHRVAATPILFVMAFQAVAADCNALIAGQIQWMATNPSHHRLRIVYASHETTRDQLVSYASGEIDAVSPGGSTGSVRTAPAMWSSQTAPRGRGKATAREITRYFSDQVVCLTPVMNTPFRDCGLSNPFSAHQSDRLAARVIGPVAGRGAVIKLKMLSWGSGEVDFPADSLQCTDQGLMVRITGSSAATFSFTRVVRPDPR